MSRIPRELRLEMLDEYGYLPVARAMASDELVHFSPMETKGFLGYLDKGGAYLVPGEPLCNANDAKAFFSEFINYSAAPKRKICFFGCSERLSESAKSAGYAVIKFGQEAVVDISGFSLRGNSMENVRRGFNHANNVGMLVSEYVPERKRDLELENEFHLISDEWLKGKKIPELGFLLGPMELDRLEGRRIFTARTQDRIEGFVILDPVSSRDGWYTDIMRRRRDAPNGINEKMLVEIIKILDGEGVRNLFLGMVPFIGLDPQIKEHRKATKLMKSLKGRIDFLYPIESEFFFKDKFSPHWEDVFIYVYPKLTTKMIYGIISAFLQGGLVRLLKHRVKSLGK